MRGWVRGMAVGLGLAGCGGAAQTEPADESPPVASAGEDHEVLIIGALAPGEPSEPPPEPPPPPLPSSRSDTADTVAAPGLAEGDALAAQAAAITFTIGAEPSAAAMADALRARIVERRDRAALARVAYGRVDGAPALLAAARLRSADLSDAFGAALLAAHVELPGDLIEMLREASPEIREEAARQVADTVTRTVAPLAHDLFCAALTEYGAALAIDPALSRARSQIAAYGPAFQASCAEGSATGE